MNTFALCFVREFSRPRAWNRGSKRSLIISRMASSTVPSTDSNSAGSTASLKLYNSLTKKKEEFIPMRGKEVLWYSCGPTVYDASHMGHARSYITFDIIRRVMTDYFGYDLFFVMNITDIDDKIINRARQKHLFQQYSDKKDRPLDEVISNCKEAVQLYEEKISKETDKDKLKMLNDIVAKAKQSISSVSKDTDQQEVIDAVKDPLSKWLDKKFGDTVTDHKIFSVLSRHWEEEYHRDMEDLNVLPAHVLTRVTEYVPEVIKFTERIIENGFGYESNGSVYFDTVKFSSSPDHRYAKLVPEAIGDLKALQEGEGELSVSADRLQEKRHNNDFALWKASKQGEPAWPSPWGHGRPGWHIECSVMACEILGSTADIHTGGVDLKFPHHDNEIAQVEAHYQSDNWINFFLHAGHLTIEGCKMSKSLKNFITIREALEKYTAAQLRLAFLQHSWNATLDYSENNMKEAIQLEKTMNEFFLSVKDRLRDYPTGIERFQKWGTPEKELSDKFHEKRSCIHVALCDSIDTPTVVRLIREIITLSNTYMNDPSLAMPNARLLENIAQYITYLLRVFGVINTVEPIGFPKDSEGQTANTEELVMPYVGALAEFRERVRDVAREKKVPEVLSLCDWVRDEVLVDLGVRLEDKTGRTVVKLVGREALLKEREKERQQMEKKKAEKEEQKRKMEELQRQREAQARIRPQDLFTTQTDKYSQFDENGLPTHDTEGKPLSDKQIKKLQKLWTAQEKKYNDAISKNGASKGGGASNSLD